jgi:4-amino-4-deoxy-L-arabinose transferase-like glycosyltransferase
MISNKNLSILILFSIFLRLICISYSQALSEEAYYWNYALHLDFAYLDHPPMVAFLIYFFGKIFGNNEWAIRIPAILCWMGMAYYSYHLSELIQKGTGLIALLLVSVLPFFFLQSMFMTPDLPLLLCWSALLYYLYRSIILDEKHYFYLAGIFLGLGLLSKYTIILIAVATLILISVNSSYRIWWKRKELYLGTILAVFLFSPVIYWNAKHDWASFAFQSTRRLNEHHQITLHLFFFYLLCFILPIGLFALIDLIRPSTQLNKPKKLFLQIYTFFPLFVFAFVSLIHQIKFNWIGPIFLAYIPWFAVLLQNKSHQLYVQHFKLSLKILLPSYVVFLGIFVLAQPFYFYQHVLKKFIDWQEFSIRMNQVAEDYEKISGQRPFFMALDKYNILSELVFYQKKALDHHLIETQYPVIGQHVIKGYSLMYEFWDRGLDHHGDNVILIAWTKKDLEYPFIHDFMKVKSSIQTIWVHDPRHHHRLKPFYYVLAQLN